jgi:serine/threonine-protein kinase HipA
MHLKNFSLIENTPGSREYTLSPAYDLLPVNLVMPEDSEELALTLNGKKRNLRRNDFLKFAEGCGVSPVTAKKLMDKILSYRNSFMQACHDSYLPDNTIEGMISLIKNRMERLEK